MTAKLGKLSVLAAAVGVSRGLRKQREENVRTRRYKEQGGMDLSHKDNHDREIRSSLRMINNTVEMSEVELNRMLDGYETAADDEIGRELKRSINTWGDQLSNDLNDLRAVKEKVERQAEEFWNGDGADSVENTMISISICALVNDECAKHVRRRSDILDQFSCDVRNLKKRIGSK